MVRYTVKKFHLIVVSIFIKTYCVYKVSFLARHYYRSIYSLWRLRNKNGLMHSIAQHLSFPTLWRHSYVQTKQNCCPFVKFIIDENSINACVYVFSLYESWNENFLRKAFFHFSHNAIALFLLCSHSCGFRNTSVVILITVNDTKKTNHL